MTLQQDSTFLHYSKRAGDCFSVENDSTAGPGSGRRLPTLPTPRSSARSSSFSGPSGNVPQVQKVILIIIKLVKLFGSGNYGLLWFHRYVRVSILFLLGLVCCT